MKKRVLFLLSSISYSIIAMDGALQSPGQSTAEGMAMLRVGSSSDCRIKKSRSAMSLIDVEKRSRSQGSAVRIFIGEQKKSSDEETEAQPLIPSRPLHVSVNMDDPRGSNEIVVEDLRAGRISPVARREVPWGKIVCGVGMIGASIATYVIYKKMYGAVGELTSGCDEMKVACDTVLAEVAQIKPAICSVIGTLCPQVPEICPTLQSWCFGR